MAGSNDLQDFMSRRLVGTWGNLVTFARHNVDVNTAMAAFEMGGELGMGSDSRVLLQFRTALKRRLDQVQVTCSFGDRRFITGLGWTPLEIGFPADSIVHQANDWKFGTFQGPHLAPRSTECEHRQLGFPPVLPLHCTSRETLEPGSLQPLPRSKTTTSSFGRVLPSRNSKLS